MKRDNGAQRRFRPPKRVDAVIFDFDGTLASLNVDFRVMREGVLSCIQSHGEDSGPFEGLFALEMVSGAAEAIARRDPAGAGVFRKEAMGIIRDAEMAGARRGGLFEGVPEMLLRLRSRGVGTAVVTRNCREAVMVMFPGIEKKADLFMPRDGLDRVKPHPDHLRAALEGLGATPEHALMVGDHPMDIAAGKAAGTWTAGVLTGLSSRESLLEAGCDLVLEKAVEIVALLETQ